MAFFDLFKSKEPDTEKLYASARSFAPAGTKRADGRYVTAAELFDHIAGFLSVPLEVYGFKYLKSKHIFRRTTDTGCDEISMWFVDHVHYHLHVYFSKRIDSLQKVITAIKYENGFNTISNYKEHDTIGVTYNNIVGRDVEIVSYRVLDKELPEILTLIEDLIIPCFDKLNDADFVNRTLNYPEKETNNPFSLLAGSGSNVIDGLIVAKTLDDPNYESLLDEYILRCPQNTVLKEQLMKLKGYLSILTTSKLK